MASGIPFFYDAETGEGCVLHGADQCTKVQFKSLPLSRGGQFIQQGVDDSEPVLANGGMPMTCIQINIEYHGQEASEAQQASIAITMNHEIQHADEFAAYMAQAQAACAGIEDEIAQHNCVNEWLTYYACHAGAGSGGGGACLEAGNYQSDFAAICEALNSDPPPTGAVAEELQKRLQDTVSKGMKAAAECGEPGDPSAVPPKEPTGTYAECADKIPSLPPGNNGALPGIGSGGAPPIPADGMCPPDIN